MQRRLPVAVAALALGLPAGQAAAGGLPSVSLRLTPATVQRGHVVRVSGSAGDCPVGDAVTILSRAFSPAHSFAGVPAVFANVRSGGAFAASTRIPPGRAPGRYAVTARCGGGNLGVELTLTVRR